jgi:hypothetical protein
MVLCPRLRLGRWFESNQTHQSRCSSATRFRTRGHTFSTGARGWEVFQSVGREAGEGRRHLSIYTQPAYNPTVQALFVELPAFARFRQDYLDDERFRELQNALLRNPEAGDVIEGTGGLRKVRHADARRGKGKRGGLRVFYFWWREGRQFWLFTLYDKDELDDLSAKERRALKDMLKRELEARRKA